MLSRLEHRFAGLRPDAIASGAIVAAFALAALVAGLAISTGSPVAILLTLGVIASAALLNALPLVVWTVLLGVLLISGPVTMFVPALNKAGWFFALLGFFLACASLLYAATARQGSSRPLPAFVVMAVAFFALGILSIAYSGGPPMEGARATKRYFQYFGLLFVLAVVPFAPSLVRRWWRFLVLLAFIQLPFALYQRLVLVPMREGMPGVDALDIVVGTFEGQLTGGGSSSVMALFLIVILAYLLALYREGAISGGRLLVLGVLAAAPLPLGDVRVIFVLLPLAAATIYFDMIRAHPVRFAVAIVVAMGLLALQAWLYLTLNTTETLEQIIDNSIAYNFGTVGYFGTGLNRTTVLTYWFDQQRLSDPIGLFFGHGLGSAFGAVGDPQPGHMNQAHAWMNIGLTAASSVLWDLGLVGFLLMVAMHVSAVICAARLVSTAKSGFDRALCRTLYAFASMLLVMPFYSDGPIGWASQQVLTAACLGLIAWRRRQSGRFPEGWDGSRAV